MKLFYLFLSVLISSVLLGQNPDRVFKDFHQKYNAYFVEVNDGTYRIEFLSDQIVETLFIPNNEVYTEDSHAVVMDLKEVSVDKKLRDEQIELSSFDLKVKVQKSPFQISYWNKDELIISEKMGFKRDSLDKIQFNLKPKETLYGGGARALGMNRRGHKLQLYNRAHYGYETHSDLMNYTLPIVVSSDRYMLHFDNAPIGFLDLDSQQNNTLEYQTISGRKTYQVIIGNTWDKLVKNYTELTGRQPMLPRWALGNFASRFGYHSQQEVMETVEAFEQNDIPLDAIILDLYWFGKEVKGTMGNLKFDLDSFPQPQKMIKDLQAKNIETLLITEPFILTTSNRWNEAVAQDILAKDSLGQPYTYDFYFGNTGLIDIYSKQGYNWFLDIYKDLLQQGVTGMWGDLGEPEVHPSDLIHATATADEVHNIYGHDWARLVQDAYHQAAPNLRPFILMRAGYAGSQRYGIIPWSGDVNRTWGGLQSQPEISLQMGMQGLGYMHSDLGGFAGANLDDELYVRWLQYGVFQPIFRPHAQEEVPSEPVYRSDWAKNLARKAINLRYQMLPYNYQLVFENSISGKPLMRPLFFDEPNNEDLKTYSDAYLWGDDILVAPVLQPEQNEKEVYMPATSDWVDMHTLAKYKGGQTYKIQLEQDYIPTFVRSGAIIPMAPEMQSTKEYDGDELILHYYFDEQNDETSIALYNDNGTLRNAYQKNQFEILNFTVKKVGRKLFFRMDSDQGVVYQSKPKKISWVIHNLPHSPLLFSHYKVNKNVDKSKSQALRIEVQWDPKTTKNMEIQW